jgi:hypothetical protein
MSCNYCPEKFKCQCAPKCEKCDKAASIYRSTIHILHNSSEDTQKIKKEPVSKIVIDTPGIVMQSRIVRDTPAYSSSRIAKQRNDNPPRASSFPFRASRMPPPQPLMSLTIQRERAKEKKKARAKERKKKNQNDLRLLLEKKKHTKTFIPRSEYFYCTTNMCYRSTRCCCQCFELKKV